MEDAVMEVEHVRQAKDPQRTEVDRRPRGQSDNAGAERDGLTPDTTVDLDEGMDPSYVSFFVAVLPLAVGAARRITGDLAGAEDAASEALARAYLRWPKLRDVEYRQAWVLRVATNQALGMVRTQARRQQILRRQPPLMVADGADDAEASRQVLVAEIRRLPSRQRQVVMLRFFADLPIDQVAAALAISPGAVKSHLHRALHSLSQRLGPDLVPGEIA
jgi:RNA polymerase sigma factor (sigma-70 family)